MFGKAGGRPINSSDFACGYLFADGIGAGGQRIDGSDFVRGEKVCSDVDIDPLLSALQAGVYIIAVGSQYWNLWTR